jgi:DNA polymerase III alpha subunit
MHIDIYGRVILTESELTEALYTHGLNNLGDVFIDDQKIVDQYNKSKKINYDSIPDLKISNELDISVEDYDKINQSQWFMPKDYCPDLVALIYDQCQTEEQKSRVTQELELFIKHNMFDLLHYLKYLVDTMRQHNIVWGVGRGSSVSSYVLYLIGIHKIDSLKYKLNIEEFFKEGNQNET